MTALAVSSRKRNAADPEALDDLRIDASRAVGRRIGRAAAARSEIGLEGSVVILDVRAAGSIRSR
ncbi:hypothetical protein [Paenibacillus periandrae]|uniref:hypothetical protein n=1 Tax=Paenibacillus periandrae TaxID=1761741 RepID=UPI001F09B38F|nr:hypothetical protein [Paenibacillus periandrae]